VEFTAVHVILERSDVLFFGGSAFKGDLPGDIAGEHGSEGGSERRYNSQNADFLHNNRYAVVKTGGR
jgi:hypothetical protein